ncbi:hypothetical protein N7528_005658 [Penicillium herquei]|nr:hypothetical protein N7528_005658 [Penicillium herquei]
MHVSIDLYIYKARTSLGLEPHMKVHAKISAHFDLKPGCLHKIFQSFCKKGNYYAIPYQLVAQYAPTHCEYFLRCCGQTSDIVTAFHT